MAPLRLLILTSTLVELFALGPTQQVCKHCTRTASKDQTRVCELESSSIYQPCRCDANCDLYRDCCPSTHHSCYSTSGDGDDLQTRFHCGTTIIGQRENPARLPPIGEHYWMVSTCNNEWIKDNKRTVDVQDIEKKCNNNSTSLPPVTDQVSGIVYRNEYCAHCNDLSSFVAWDYSFVCDSQLRALLNDSLSEDDFNNYCTIHSFAEPRVPPLTNPARLCYPQIDTCLELDTLLNIDTVNMWNSSYYDTTKDLCTQGRFQYQVIQRENNLSTFPYRNEYCALCNGVSQLSIDCFQPPDVTPSLDFTTPFRIVLNMFGTGRVMDSSSQMPNSIHVFCSSNTEVYDPVTKHCRPVVIQDCKDVGDEDNCTQCMGNLIALNRSTPYVLVNADMLLYNEEQHTVEYNMSNGDPVICVNFSTNGTEPNNINIFGLQYPEAYIILSYVGCPLSVIGCILILLTYSIFKELRTLPSLILMQLAIAILISNLIILLSGPVIDKIEGARVLCTSLAILTHYIFLTQFSWMSLMSTEIARKLHAAFKMKTTESKTHERKLLVTYLLFGWCTPFVIVIVTSIVNFTTTNLVLYGVLDDENRGQCWINHLASVLVSFYTPVAISLVYNTVIFIVVTIFLCVSSHSHSKLSKTSDVPFLRLNIGVFSVSGITWIFGLIAILPYQGWAWIPFIVLNSTQGFIIFIAFLGTKKIVLLYISLCCRRKSDTSFRSDGISAKDTSVGMKKDRHNMSEEKLV